MSIWASGSSTNLGGRFYATPVRGRELARLCRPNACRADRPVPWRHGHARGFSATLTARFGRHLGLWSSPALHLHPLLGRNWLRGSGKGWHLPRSTILGMKRTRTGADSSLSLPDIPEFGPGRVLHLTWGRSHPACFDYLSSMRIQCSTSSRDTTLSGGVARRAACQYLPPSERATQAGATRTRIRHALPYRNALACLASREYHSAHPRRTGKGHL